MLSYLAYSVLFFFLFFNVSFCATKKVPNKEIKQALKAESTSIDKLSLSTVEIQLPPYKEDVYSRYYKKRRYQSVIAKAKKDARKDAKKASTKQKSPSTDKDLDKFRKSYIKGMSYLKTRNYRKAISHLLESVTHNTKINDWIYYNLVKSYSKIGQANKTIYYSKLLRENYKDINLVHRVIEIEAKTYLRQKSYSRLVREFSGFLEKRQSSDSNDSLSTKVTKLSRKVAKAKEKLVQRLLYFIGYAYEHKRHYSKALLYYKKVIRLSASRQYQKEAMKGIKNISYSYKRKLDSSDVLYIARYYYKVKKDYRMLAKLLRKIKIDKRLKNNESELFLYFSLLLKSHERSYKKDMAKLYYKALSHFQEDSLYHKKISYLFASYLVRKNPKKASTLLYPIVMDKNHPMAKEAARRIIPLIKNHIYDLQKKKGDEGVSFLSSLVSRLFYFKFNREIERVFVSLIGARQDYSFIVDVFTKVDYSPLSPYFRVVYYYWLAELYLEMGNKSKAIAFFKKTFLEHGRNYYTHSSQERIVSLLEKDEQKLNEFYSTVQQDYKIFFSSDGFNSRLAKLKYSYDFTKVEDELFQKAFIFFYVGEMRKAYELFKAYLVEKDQGPIYYLVIAKMFSTLGLNQFVIRYSDFLTDYLNGSVNKGRIIPVLSEYVYPIYYKELVFDRAKRYNVDPFLVMAIIREESRFFTRALSVSGAVGLMQILPNVGKWLANLGIAQRVKYVDLYDKDINVNLGVKYLRFLLRRSSLLKSVAGYNGGPTRIRRLARVIGKRNKLINEKLFVELIDIRETRLYVKKVINSYYMYKMIYSPS